MSKSSRKPNVVDVHIAKRVREARARSGLSQTEAGAKLGVSFQQLQKYENGSNRISVGSLFMLSRLYGVPVTWFFQGADAVLDVAEAA